MTDTYALSQLRHLYANMMNGCVRDTSQAKRVATGMLGPAIERLEDAQKDDRDLMAILRHYVGADILDNGPEGSMCYLSDVLEELIAKRVATERAECAKVCEGHDSDGAWSPMLDICAAAIRARKEIQE